MNSISIKKLFHIILIFFPLSYIIGIALTETILFLYLLFFFLNYENKKIFFDIKIILLFLFSLYIGLNANFQITDDLKYSSIFHFRYPMFALAVCFFFEQYLKDKSNSNFIILVFLMLIIILLFDSFLQFFVGENILGQKLTNYRVSSFFGDELILGSFLIRLLPIVIWYIFYFKINLEKNRQFFIVFFAIYFSSVFLSGERTSLALLFFTLFVSIIFIEKLRLIWIKSLIIFLVFVLSVAVLDFGKTDITHRIFAKTYKQIFIKKNIEVKDSKKINSFSSNLKNIRIFSKDHEGHILLAKKLFLESPIYGVGPKGFRHYCRSVKYDPSVGVCSTHPHNLIAQIFSELGIIGFIFYIIFFSFIIYNFLKVRNKSSNNFDKNSFLIISIGLLINLFPFLPSGNFFNNWISSFIYFNIGLFLLSYKKIFYK